MFNFTFKLTATDYIKNTYDKELDLRTVITKHKTSKLEDQRSSSSS